MPRGSLHALRLAYATPAERRHRVDAALRAESGNVRATAARLGVSRSALNRWIAADAELVRAVEASRLTLLDATQTQKSPAGR
jgi:DNA-binding NtrC family response regulator